MKKETRPEITDMSDESVNKQQPRMNWFTWLKRYVSIPLILSVVTIVYVLGFSDFSCTESDLHNTNDMILQKKIAQSSDSLKYYQELNEQLSNDPETMEKVVRENYHMQRLNEDVYIFEDE